MGSKNRISKYLLPIILKDRKEGQYYVEPFVGGANMIDKVDGNRIGADGNKWVIEALLSIRDEVSNLPKNNIEFTKEMYQELRKSDNYKYKGYVGFSVSFGSKWLGGWSSNKKGDDYVARAYRTSLKQSPLLQGVDFIHSNYDELEIPNNSIIYCDPPYEGTTKYKDNFNHIKFWNWCREKSKNNIIIISEYNAPKDFICVWKKEIKVHIRNNKKSMAIEKLFTCNDVKSLNIVSQTSIFDNVKLLGDKK